MKSIVLCADDYGQAEEISQGILALLQIGRLSATSCLVTSDDWALSAKALSQVKHHADIGLHLNLTQGKPLSLAYQQQYGDRFMSLSRLLPFSLIHGLKQEIIEAEINAQIDRFMEMMGCPPDFLDGHQHVHHFPIIRNAFIRIYQQRFTAFKPYVRLVKQASLHSFKKLIIHGMGVTPFQRLLEQADIPHNTAFAGIYAFAKAGEYRDYFRQFLREISAPGIIMCHPGKPAHATSDEIAEARACEYRYFSSQAFVEDCLSAQIEIQRFSFKRTNNLL